MMAFAFKIFIDYVSFVVNGVALKLLWGWFIVPTFGLPILSVPIAIGIILIASVLTSSYNPSLDQEDGVWKIQLYNLLLPLLSVIVGFVIYTFF